MLKISAEQKSAIAGDEQVINKGELNILSIYGLSLFTLKSMRILPWILMGT